MSRFFNTDLSQQQFLEQYWQKKPLLIRQAFPDFVSPITAEELAGLACEAEVESRLIEENQGRWTLVQGPFSEADFARLPDSHWTVLVQDVEKHVPELQALLAPFDFIPDWRRDDLMISYAAKAGSVGPHTDSYDVFLLQGMGRRRWQISQQALHEPALLEGVDMQILAEFAPDQDWVLETGDMLYLPPHFAHYGVALDACMTFSVGFRAPTQLEIMDALVEVLMEKGLGTQHYADPDLQLNSHRAEIDAQTLVRVRKLLHQLVDDAAPQLATLFGRLVTQNKPALAELAQGIEDKAMSIAEVMAQAFSQGRILQRHPYQRFAWCQLQGQGQLFAAGEVYHADAEAIPYLPMLAENSRITLTDWQQLSQNKAAVALLSQLVAAGSWFWT